MKVVSKDVFIEHRENSAAFPAFVSYIHREKPILIHRYGWELESDNRDDWTDIVSFDNGRTWNTPTIAQQSTAVPEGKIKYAEYSGFFDADTNQFITMAGKRLYPNDRLDVDQPMKLEIKIYDCDKGIWGPATETDFGFKFGLSVSFTFPIKIAKSRLLFPAIRTVADASGKTIHYPNCWAPADQSLVVIGDYQSDGSIEWHPSRPVEFDLQCSTRGFDENTVAELPDGRIAMIIRGSNEAAFDRPGYKWMAFSDDQGETWSKPQPMSFSDGKYVESSATGSALFRSIANGKLYWMGNLCMGGEKARGNWPRSPLVILEVKEQPFAFKRDTLMIIDQRSGSDSPGTQLSNFRFYQDRETGDVVVFLTRFGERRETEWKKADYYRYRIAVS